MAEVGYLIGYLIIGAAISWVLKFRGLTPLRRGLDRLTAGNTENLEHMLRVAGIGQEAPYEQEQRTTTHKATFGVRMLGTFLVVALLLMICPLLGGDPALPLPGLEGLLIYLILVLLGAWYLTYMWTYEIVVTDKVISAPTWWLKRKDHDISTLDMMESDAGYMWRLYFWDGKRIEVLRYVAGRKALERRLKRQIELNRRH
ncbi:hypothetical protein [Psychromarinibacter sp. S121]|uniref:hypothetical protein n=1 Tax=Psychromarinibacter sp. S121 TaxID=3415127 RepID=UPI003C7DAF83